MGIKYTQILNSYVSTQGGSGIFTNYIYYTVLVADTDGSYHIFDVEYNHLDRYLPYVRTTADEIDELKETVNELHRDIEKIIDQKLQYCINSLYEIPDIKDKNEAEALKLLKDAGLTPVLENEYPEGTPQNGVVHEFHRDKENFKKVFVRIIHALPNVEGMKIDEALMKLKEAGFTADVTYKLVSNNENGIVLRCNRYNINQLQVSLEVSSSIQDLNGMHCDEACKLLHDQGYNAVIEKQVNTGTPGLVNGWISLAEKSVKLYVNIPEKTKAKCVDVKWNNMQDSSGDTYAAIAEFNNRSHELIITLSYTLGIKSKHQITGVTDSSTLKGIMNPKIDYSKILEPNTKGELEIKIIYHKFIETIPTDISLTIDTQYGLIKKRDSISLKFHIEW